MIPEPVIERPMIDVNAQVAERFAANVAGHRISILRDEGLYRHLRFNNPEQSGHWFELVTWPDCLVIHGDIHSFAFSRIDDMFRFFRGHEINPDYWFEKAIAYGSEMNPYSEAKFRARLLEEAEEYELEFPGLVAAVRYQLLDDWSDWDITSEHEAMTAADDFAYLPEGVKREPFRFDDVREWDLRDWGYHYLWCCHAIQWGIQRYDEAKALAQ